MEPDVRREFPGDPNVYWAFRWWIELEALERIWAALVEEWEELGGVNWERQAAGGEMRLVSGDLAGSTDRVRNGVKRSLLAEANGDASSDGRVLWRTRRQAPG